MNLIVYCLSLILLLRDDLDCAFFSFDRFRRVRPTCYCFLAFVFYGLRFKFDLLPTSGARWKLSTVLFLRAGYIFVMHVRAITRAFI